MCDSQDKLPQPGERWNKMGGQVETVIISELYYPSVKCPYHNRPDVRFIHEVTGKVGTMALRAFLMAYTDRVIPCFSDERCSEKESTWIEQSGTEFRNDFSSDSFKKWKVKDSRRFSHNEK